MANCETSDFYCTCCGNRGIPVLRRNGAYRELGHLKKLFCLTCQREVNHAEIRPFSKYTYEDFKLEFDNGNFNTEGQRVMKYGLFKEKLRKEGVI